MDRFLMRTRWLHVIVGSIGQNYHGPDFTTLRRTWQIVRMDSYSKQWTLYLYDRDGQTRHIRVAFPRWLGDWPSTPKNASQPIKDTRHD